MTLHPYSDVLAYSGTATRRRDARRRVRNALGTSRDQAPSAMTALDAALALSQLLEDATAGNLSLRVQRGNAVATISLREAREVVKEAIAARSGS